MERVFRSLKTEWMPSLGYASFEQARRDTSNYLMGHYNHDRLHQYSQGLLPVAAEEKLNLLSELVDHYKAPQSCLNSLSS